MSKLSSLIISNKRKFAVGLISTVALGLVSILLILGVGQALATGPELDLIGNQNVNEQATLNFTATTTTADPDFIFTLDDDAVSLGMAIDRNTGVFSWTPDEAQGGSSYNATITVTDPGELPEDDLADSETFLITVSEVNAAPVLAAIGNKPFEVGTSLNFTVSASDGDDPLQTLAFSLDETSELAGMEINANTGDFSWDADQNGPFIVTVFVTDSANPAMTDGETITISEPFYVAPDDNLPPNGDNCSDPDFNTIQGAVDAIDGTVGSGSFIIVCKRPASQGEAYQESVDIFAKNAAATSETDRIVIQAEVPADAAASAGDKVIIDPGNLGDPEDPQDPEKKHAFLLKQSKFIAIKGFDLRNAASEAIVVQGGNNTNSDIRIEGNDIHLNGYASLKGGIRVGTGNPNTWVVNDLIRDNRENGLGLGAGGNPQIDGPKYVVNNTITDNGWNGISTKAAEEVFVINNLIVGNGTDVASSGGRFGIQSVNMPQPEQLLLNNVFYSNGGGDIGDGLLDPADANNLTTLANEGPDSAGNDPALGISRCTFFEFVLNDNGTPNNPDDDFLELVPGVCSVDETADDIFVDPFGSTPDFHLLEETNSISPAVDAGSPMFVDGIDGLDWVPAIDFENDLRPLGPALDVGYDEVGDAITNGPPVAENDSATLFEDSVTGITIDVLANDFDPDGDNLDPSSTNVLCFGCAETSNGTLTNLGGGTFSYIPDPDFSGEDSFIYEVCDDRTPAACSVALVNITVSPVNDEPSFTILGDQAAVNNAGAQVVPNFAVASPGGGADESGQTFTYNANENSGLFSVQPAIDPTGQLTFTPLAGTDGDALVTVSVTDSGGTANGGDDTSPDQTFVITIIDATVFFVDNSYTGESEGSQTQPFKTLADAFAPGIAGPGDVVFVFTGSGPYAGGITLSDQQQLVGEGAGLGSPFANPTIDAGTNPVLTDGVTLASNNSIRGLNLGSPAGSIALAGVNVGTFDVSGVTIDATGSGVDISFGTLDVSFDSLSSISNTGPGIRLDGVSGTLQVDGGDINVANGPALDISAAGAGLAIDVTLANASATNTAGTGIRLNSVSGTFDVSGGIIDTTGGAGVDINGLGSGVALSVALESVAVDGSTNGISLSNTTGSFTVTGDGSTSTQGGNDSGGIIQNISGDGIALNQAENVVLENMTIGDPAVGTSDSDYVVGNVAGDGVQVTAVTGLTLKGMTIARTGGHGINANQVTDVTVDNSLILNAGNGQGEHGLNLADLLGDNFVTDSLFDGFNESGIVLTNASGTVDLTISNTTFQDNKNTSGNAGENAIVIEAQDTAQIVAKVTGGSVFDDLAGQAIQGTSVGTSSDLQLTIENSSFNEGDAGDGVIIFNPDNSGSGNITVSGNTFNDDAAGPFAVLLKNDSSATLQATVIGNTVNDMQLLSLNHDDTGGGGAANGTSIVKVDDNTATSIPNGVVGVDVAATESGPVDPDPDVELILTNNTLAFIDPNASSFTPTLRISAQNDTRLNLRIAGNTITDDSGGLGEAIRLDQQDNSAFRIEGLVGVPADYLAANNTIVAGVVTANGTFSAGAANDPSPTTQPNPLLAVASGSGGSAHHSIEDFSPVILEAIGRLAESGWTDQQISVLRLTKVEIRDLPSNFLGYTNSRGHILIDEDGAGHGWFVDPTPGDDVEFTPEMMSNPTNAARSKIDLLTVVMHEFGHVLGMEHAGNNSKIGETLKPGTRNLLKPIPLFDGIEEEHMAFGECTG